MDNGIQHYQAVLRDLELRRTRCQSELADIEQTISGIRKLLAKDATLFAQIPQSAAPESTGKYAGMSVRWGVLRYLAEEAKGPVTTAVIAAALQEGGMTTRGRDFANNVSAVISGMVRTRNEAEAVEGGYQITENGRHAWAAIKMTPQYQARSLFSASVQ